MDATLPVYVSNVKPVPIVPATHHTAHTAPGTNGEQSAHAHATAPATPVIHTVAHADISAPAVMAHPAAVNVGHRQQLQPPAQRKAQNAICPPAPVSATVQAPAHIRETAITQTKIKHCNIHN